MNFFHLFIVKKFRPSLISEFRNIADAGSLFKIEKVARSGLATA